MYESVNKIVLAQDAVQLWDFVKKKWTFMFHKSKNFNGSEIKYVMEKINW